MLASPNEVAAKPHTINISFIDKSLLLDTDKITVHCTKKEALDTNINKTLNKNDFLFVIALIALYLMDRKLTFN
jgi:hypothetical protein